MKPKMSPLRLIKIKGKAFNFRYFSRKLLLFDLGWTELLLIGIVALIVVGPKDLPGMFRTLGKLMARVRALSLIHI